MNRTAVKELVNLIAPTNQSNMTGVVDARASTTGDALLPVHTAGGPSPH
jgi:hypothetical protein